MNKAEFLEKVRDGLREVPDDERVAAMQYYTEYLDDAGPEREAEVLAELGSPEDVAAMVRAESEADGWVPPEKPAQPAAEGQQAPAQAPPPVAQQVPPAGPPPAFGMGTAPVAPPPPGSQGWAPPPHGYGGPVPPMGVPVAPPPPKAKKYSAGFIVLIVVLCILFSPVILGLAGGVVGVLSGLLVTLIIFLLVPLIVGVALVASGVFAIVVGSFGFSISLPTGLASVGVGILVLGLGLLCMVGGGILIGKVLPAVFRGLATLLRKIFRRNKNTAAQ